MLWPWGSPCDRTIALIGKARRHRSMDTVAFWYPHLALTLLSGLTVRCRMVEKGHDIDRPGVSAC